MRSTLTERIRQPAPIVATQRNPHKVGRVWRGSFKWRIFEGISRCHPTVKAILKIEEHLALCWCREAQESAQDGGGRSWATVATSHSATGRQPLQGNPYRGFDERLSWELVVIDELERVFGNLRVWIEWRGDRPVITKRTAKE